MPTYQYQCQKCELIFEEFHSMSERVEKCKECSSPVKRLLSTTFNIKKSTNFGTQKPGHVVKQYIKDVKEEVKQEKKRILAQEYEAE